MNATELRIGNLINLYDDYNSVVTGFTNTGKVWFVKDPIDNKCAFEISSIKPIPLTEEQLLKLGYSIDESFPAFYQVIGHRIWMCNELFLCDKNGVVLKYVHQLQNLYYALTNTELTIKQ